MQKSLPTVVDQRLVDRLSPYLEPANASHVEKWKLIGFRLGATQLTELESLILDAWEALTPAAQQHGDVIDGEQLNGWMESAGGTNRRSAEWLHKKCTIVLRELYDVGVLERQRVLDGSRGGAFHYRLRSPEAAAAICRDIDPASLSKKSQTRRENLLEVLVANALTRHAINTEEPWSYLLVTQLIERCSRPKQVDPRTYISSSVIVNGELVNTEASATLWGLDDPKHGIVVADDAQLILALLTTAMQSISRDAERGITPKNLISVDLLQIAKQLNSGNELSTYRAFQSSMARIANTEFRLSAEPGGRFAERISKMINSTADTIRFRLLSQVFLGRVDEEQSDIWGDNWHPSQGIRHVTFSLTSLIWQDLLSGHGWMVHPGLLYERSGQTHKIYNHLKAHSSEDRPYCVTGDNLMRYIQFAGEGVAQESRSARRFCSQLWRLFTDHATRTTGYLESSANHQTEKRPLHLSFFDLELYVTPIDGHTSAMQIEARFSRESRWLIKRQENVTASNVKRLQSLRHS